ncbi:MAG TPA: hypothetical protein VN684_05055 [Terriglobales bacterium]|jgi:hypothetical protein|nr:hypothetical protein [Terriglobales bacterium]
MIAVIASLQDRTVVHEFFELFKVQWEFYRPGRQYDVLLCAGDESFDETAAGVVLHYGARALPCDAGQKIQVQSPGRSYCDAFRQQGNIPVYGDSVVFPGKPTVSLVDLESGQPLTYSRELPSGVAVRIGYDLFREVRMLLTAGQPVENAGIPALDLHIAFLRELMLTNGASFAEILPVPAGYQFIACLTHDVDHPSIRRHKFDHTMLGFLYRAIAGSLVNFLRGRGSFRHVLKNWAAALKLPLVFLGLAEDFWLRFPDYANLEKGRPSSFFVIPFSGRPGSTDEGPAPANRAAAYGAADIAVQIRHVRSAGCEIALHGIDAWRDQSAAGSELQEICRVSGARATGVRMHWLYFKQQSPAVLEAAGAEYDSTIGYNQTIGYRAGTSQVYKPLECVRLLELPLHIMDTALFYPSYLDLSSRHAALEVDGILQHAVRAGGVVTVNWHDRSIAPERLWREFYVHVMNELQEKGAWFATANDTVSWFRQRRMANFENLTRQMGPAREDIEIETVKGLPGLRIQVHHSRKRFADPAPLAPASGLSATAPLSPS